MADISSIEFIRDGAELLDEVEPLWRKLNEYHRGKSTHFAARFASFTFAERKRDLLCKAESSALLVEMARDREAGADVGYCVSSVRVFGPYLNAFRNGVINSKNRRATHPRPLSKLREGVATAEGR